jgi:L-alanine-DL-glutamate epimerase-like enolase superfamily enzyme
MQHKLHLFGRSGPYLYALSGVDIALWDIAGKRAHKPLWRLLADSAPDSLEGYASLVWYGDLGLVERNAATAADAGFHHIKLHEVTRESVVVAAAAAKDARIMLDTNCPWSVDEAVGMARTLKDSSLYWLEEPVWPPEDYEGLARVRAEGIPIAAGENAAGFFDFKRMFELKAVDLAQPSITKVGGVSEMLRIINLAEANGIAVTPHCPYFGPGFLATRHLAAIMKKRPLIEALWIDMECNPFDPWVRACKGRFSLPHGPGLGCDPDMQVLAHCTA